MRRIRGLRETRGRPAARVHAFSTESVRSRIGHAPAGRVAASRGVAYVAGCRDPRLCVHLAPPPPKVKMTRTEIRPAFDPALHPIGYALASELLAEGTIVDVPPMPAALLALSAPPDLFGWERDAPRRLTRHRAPRARRVGSRPIRETRSTARFGRRPASHVRRVRCPYVSCSDPSHHGRACAPARRRPSTRACAGSVDRDGRAGRVDERRRLGGAAAGCRNRSTAGRHRTPNTAVHRCRGGAAAGWPMRGCPRVLRRGRCRRPVWTLCSRSSSLSRTS